MYVKIHESARGRIIAVCDEELIGKKFEEGDLILDVSERFYKGEIKKEEEVLDILKNEKNLNLVGEKTIKFAIDNNLINEEHVKTIDNIPYAQIYEL
jgi:hypothetical protein